VLEGLRGEENISELWRREGIAASMYYGWSKEFLEAGKRRLAGVLAAALARACEPDTESDGSEQIRLRRPALSFSRNQETFDTAAGSWRSPR
jgi:transposase-like protein